MLDETAKELISQLLNKSPDARSGGSFASLKAHKYFGNLEWNDLMERTIKPPYFPRK
jgi:cGMP-dependent protein kinase